MIQYYFCKAEDEADQYKSIFGCEAGFLPFKHLGIPIHYRRLLNKEWNPVEDRLKRNLVAGKASYSHMEIG
jgi:hypothetical protein